MSSRATTAAPSHAAPVATEDVHHGHTVLLGAFSALFGTGLVALRLAGRPLPSLVQPRDVLLLGLATTRLSRLVSRDRIGRVLRAPFTTLPPGATDAPSAATAAAAEIPRDDVGPVRAAIGELLTCPRCVGVWTAAALGLGYVAAPRATRLFSAILSAAAVSDFANAELAALREIIERGPPRGSTSAERARA